jgi:hypothetical protein
MMETLLYLRTSFPTLVRLFARAVNAQGLSSYSKHKEWAGCDLNGLGVSGALLSCPHVY